MGTFIVLQEDMAHTGKLPDQKPFIQSRLLQNLFPQNSTKTITTEKITVGKVL
jgi:hypothetical protein